MAISIGVLPISGCQPVGDLVDSADAGAFRAGRYFPVVYFDGDEIGQHAALNLSQLTPAEQIIYLRRLGDVARKLAQRIEGGR